MKFTVTYRKPDGSLAKEVVDATDRAAAVAACRKRGISPSSVAEGALAGAPSARPAWVKGAIAGAVVVAAALVAWFVLAPKPQATAPAPEPKPAKPKAECPAPVPARKPKPVQTNAVPVAEAPKTNKYHAVKNPWGTPIPADLEYKPHWAYTEEDYARIDPSYKERHERFKERQANNPWKTTADSQLSVLLFSELGQPSLLIPFSRQFKDQFLKSLEQPIIIGKDDSPELKAQKKQMIETKIWLKQQMDEGKDIVEILNNEYERQAKVRGLRENLLRELREIQKTATSVQEVEDYVNAANKMLEAEGAAKVALPMTLTKIRLQAEAQKKEEVKK